MSIWTRMSFSSLPGFSLNQLINEFKECIHILIHWQRERKHKWGKQADQWTWLKSNLYKPAILSLFLVNSRSVVNNIRVSFMLYCMTVIDLALWQHTRHSGTASNPLFPGQTVTLVCTICCPWRYTLLLNSADQWTWWRGIVALTWSSWWWSADLSFSYQYSQTSYIWLFTFPCKLRLS